MEPAFEIITIDRNNNYGVTETGDQDGDGTLDCADFCPTDKAKTKPGVCGCGEVEKNVDDTDKDGVADCIDRCPYDGSKTKPGICGCGVAETADTDGDGTLDCQDSCPKDANKTEPEICGCAQKISERIEGCEKP